MKLMKRNEDTEQLCDLLQGELDTMKSQTSTSLSPPGGVRSRVVQQIDTQLLKSCQEECERLRQVNERYVLCCLTKQPLAQQILYMYSLLKAHMKHNKDYDWNRLAERIEPAKELDTTIDSLGSNPDFAADLLPSAMP